MTRIIHKASLLQFAFQHFSALWFKHGRVKGRHISHPVSLGGLESMKLHQQLLCVLPPLPTGDSHPAFSCTYMEIFSWAKKLRKCKTHVWRGDLSALQEKCGDSRYKKWKQRNGASRVARGKGCRAVAHSPDRTLTKRWRTATYGPHGGNLLRENVRQKSAAGDWWKGSGAELLLDLPGSVFQFWWLPVWPASFMCELCFFTSTLMNPHLILNSAGKNIFGSSL